MAIVRQCDRCKEIYNNNSKVPKYILQRYDRDDMIPGFKSMMLCDNCLEELEAFVQERKPQ